MTAYLLASRFVGEVFELPGGQHHPFIQWAHMLCRLGPDSPDEVPWCSSFTNVIAWLLKLPRSGSAAARSWLTVGIPITLTDAVMGFDVVVLQRGSGLQPDAKVINAPGHVGFYAGVKGQNVIVLGGNQGNGVTRQEFPVTRILGVRRLA